MNRLLCVCFLLGISVPVRPQTDYGFEFSKAGTGGLQFLKIGVGAREAAMGEAASSLTRDVNSVFWNVGALPFVEDPQAAFTHNQWLNGSRLDALAGAYPVGSFVVGLSLWRFAIEEFEETTVLEPEGTGRMVSAGDVGIGLAVARRFTDRLTIGVQIKFVRETLDSESLNEILFDVGTVYYTGFHHLRLAFSLQHFGPDMKYFNEKFRAPLLFRISAGEDVVKTEDHRLSVAVDLVHPTDNNEWVNVGGEYEFLGSLSLRGGYRINHDEGNITLGAGVSAAGLTGVDARLDYAYVKFGEILGATHRITLLLGL